MTEQQPLLGRGALERLQLGLLLVVLAMVPWLVSPGRTEPDTKIDLTLTPWRYLGRSLDAWNNHAGLGELQNQAYGYLFPMGPVFGVCRSLALPAWATQRVWWTLLLVVSFLGTQQLLRRLGVAGAVPALVGGAAYALAPRMLTVLPVISIEAWPMALAPWLVIAVLPLVRRELSRAELVRCLALAGVLTAALGGVNATASGVVLALPFAFLITHPVGRRRLVSWLVAVVLGALWWLLPLLVLGRYAYPFLDYIETSSITTAVTSVPNVLRGADDWIAYILDSASHPVWQGGWVLAQSVTAILATGAVAAVGCWGLLRQRGHLARWTLLCAVGATLFMVVGHGGTVGSPLSQSVRGLLDGSLAPLRNIHKADPVLRLPLVIGFTAVLQRVSVSRRARDRFVPAVLALAVAVAATPIWQGRVGASDAYGAIPAQWTQVAHEIDRAATESGGSTMLLPNSRTSTYTWGSTTDEPLSALAKSPVVTRAAAPLGIPASTRILDVADELAASGETQPSLAAGLARLGIKRVVLRRNLAASVQAQPWQQVQRTLARSPGFRIAATYGKGRSALTVYDVTAAHAADVKTSDATTYGATPLTVAGGPEAMFGLYTTGLLSAQQWMQLDSATSTHADVVTDSMPWRSYNNGVPTAYGYSPVLTRDNRTPTHIGAKDLLPADDPARQPAREWIGWSQVSVSSSGADPFAKNYLSVRDGPAAAFDNDPSTAWLTGDHQGTAWLRGELPGRTVREIRLQLAGRSQHATLPDTVRVRVGNKQVSVAVRGRSEVTVPVPATKAGSVEVRLTAPSDAVDPVLGITEMRVTGTKLGSVIDIPQTVDPSSQALLLHRLPEDGTTITRQVHLTGSAPATATVWLRASDGVVSTRCGAAGSVTVTDAGRTTRIPLQAKGSGRVAKGGLVEAKTCIQSGLSGALSSPEPATGVSKGRARNEPVSKPRGTAQTISITGKPGLTPELATFGKNPTPPDTTRKVTSMTGDSGQRVVKVSAGAPGVVALSEGFNAGWQATDGSGTSLQAVEVDGWRQGFRVTGTGADTITMSFEPTTPQRLGLFAGGLVALALLLTFLAAAFVCRRSARSSAALSSREARAAYRRVGRGTSPYRDLAAEARGLDTPSSASLLRPLDQLARNTRPALGAVAAVVVGFLAAGPAGLLAGLVAAAVPVRWLRHTAGGAMVAAALALGFFGVVDAQSAGAIAGQLLGTVTLSALARAGCVFGRAPTAAPDAPPATPTRSQSAR
ncbi:alpha-(1-_3)-arabinofuranosyltransferase domain-containing protein [Flexivirga alba]|uniref:Alpha-(1->3)-arabinofuranosyltransferase family protein n=1 Tax=Flexivirga alba TaxID=702742 RepID=A0ABW2AK18_9MICO